MRRSIGILLGLVLATGAGLAHAGKGGGGGHGGGRGVGHMSGGRPGMAGPQFTTGPMRFTTGTARFTTGPHPSGRPIVGIRPGPIGPGRPFPHHRVVVGGAVIVGAPYYWYPPYPYPYPYPYQDPYASPYYPPAPAYGSGYEQAPTYIEQGDISYYCPDSRDYYPNVANCPSQWLQVLPGTANAN